MKCYLHIGTEKTGSSLLQEWLYLNRDVLSEQGVYLCESIESPNNRKLCAYFQPNFDDYFRHFGIDSEEQREVYFDGFLDGFRQELEQAKEHHHTVVLSSEHFSSRLLTLESIQALHDELKQHFTEIKVIAYVREQSQLRRSLYSTALRGGEVASLDDFSRDISPEDYYYNYDAMFGCWAEVFSESALSIGIYDRRLFADGDIRRDFLDRIDLTDCPAELDYSITSANESLSRMQAILLRLVNQYCTAGEDAAANFELRSRLTASILDNQQLKIGKLISTDDEHLYEIFDECNRHFFQRFFQSEDNLFARPQAPSEEFTVRQGDLNNLDVEIFGLVHHLLTLEHPTLPTNYISTDAEDINLFRDVALRYESGTAPSKEQAIRLMELARRARPMGPVINDFLRRHKE